MTRWIILLLTIVAFGTYVRAQPDLLLANESATKWKLNRPNF